MPQASALTNRANSWAYQELCSPRYCMDYSLLFSTVISCAFQFVDFSHMECDNSRISFVIKSWILLIIKATPIKCIDPDDTSGQLKLEGWLYIVFNFFTIVNEEALLYWQLARGGSILLVILVRRLHFIDYLGQEAPFCWVNLRGCWSSFSFMSKTMLGIGWSFILWPMLYLEGWSFRSSYFIGVAQTSTSL